ncbi:16S rRNA (cytosine(1407)-C(5))-methyltransferase RsmF [Neptunicella sp. SCSIO 80796]|uniref:16S rRNA (cytosine(1407)-C(5))-methyltransferase RsmF n=1 Tax=Neptunicella plasticusilytica TaxID=3117012 RepID=UPI003A4D6929
MNNKAYIPEEFISSVAAILPRTLDINDFIRHCQTPLRKSIRINTLKISVNDFIHKMTAEGWLFDPIPWCQEGFWLERPDIQEQTLPLGNTAEHLAGLFYIQEASSMLPPVALIGDNPQPGKILDMAAAPGSKSTQLAGLMSNRGLLIANEFSSSRIKVLSANLQRCGVVNCAMTHFDGSIFGNWTPETFDCILLDAPCSGEGTIRKDPDAMKNWSVESIQAIASTQKKLIESAFIALKPGGTLVYSTCTMNLQENQHICLHLQQRFAEAVEFISLANLFDGAEQAVTEQGFLHIWPQLFDSEGFFVAKIAKKSSVDYCYQGKALNNFPFSKVTRKQRDELERYVQQQFGWSLPDDLLLYQRDNQYWLFPAPVEDLIGKLRLQRIGLKLAEQHKHGFKFTHEGALAYGQQFSKNLFELTPSQFGEYYHGRDIRWPLNQNSGEALVCYQGYPVGLVKALKGKLKNNLPRDLVKDGQLVSWE